jgi:hypothetical protein
VYSVPQMSTVYLPIYNRAGNPYLSRQSFENEAASADSIQRVRSVISTSIVIDKKAFKNTLYRLTKRNAVRVRPVFPKSLERK